MLDVYQLQTMLQTHRHVLVGGHHSGARLCGGGTLSGKSSADVFDGYRAVFASVVAAMRQIDGGLLIVGGAGSLKVAAGVDFVDFSRAGSRWLSSSSRGARGASARPRLSMDHAEPLNVCARQPHWKVPARPRLPTSERAGQVSHLARRLCYDVRGRDRGSETPQRALHRRVLRRPVPLLRPERRCCSKCRRLCTQAIWLAPGKSCPAASTFSRRGPVYVVGRTAA